MNLIPQSNVAGNGYCEMVQINSSPSTQIPPEAKEFLISEHSSLREEILSSIKGIEEAQRNALVFSGAVWAWFSTQHWDLKLFPALFLPLIITIAYWFKHIELSRSIRNIADYITNIESELALPRFGWEHYAKGHAHFRNWNRVYWILLTILNLALGLYAWRSA